MKKSVSTERKIEEAVLMMVNCIRKGCRNEKPLIWHSLKVGCRLYELGLPKEVVIAGILHDLLEDTDCKISQIKNKFGSKVAKLVLACTYNSKIKDYKKRWHKFLPKIKKTGREAMIIKVADANENLVFVPLIKRADKLEEVLWKHRFVIKLFKPEIGELPIFKEYQRNYKKIVAEVSRKNCKYARSLKEAIL